MANDYTTRLKKRLPAVGDENWDDEWHDNEKIDDVVLGALLTANRLLSGGAVTLGTGLVPNYAAMKVLVAGVVYDIAGGSIAATAAVAGQEQVNWLYISSAGVVTISTTPPTGDYVPLALVDTSDLAVIRLADLRPLVADLAGQLHAATAQTTLADADEVGIWNAAAQALRRLTGASLKAIFAAIGGSLGQAFATSTLTANGTVSVTSPTGQVGYGAGAGGTVTQATSKTTAITLNRPCGLITTHNAALAAGASVSFACNNSLAVVTSCLVCNIYAPSVADPSIYTVKAAVYNGAFYFTVTNTSGGSLSEALAINFAIIKGVTA